MLRGLFCLHMAIFILKKYFTSLRFPRSVLVFHSFCVGHSVYFWWLWFDFILYVMNVFYWLWFFFSFFSLLFIFIAFVVCSSNSFSVVLFAHFFLYLLFPSFSFTYNMICLVVLLLVTRILHITFILFITHIYTCTQTPYESLSRLTGKRCMLSIRPVLSSEAPFRVIISLKNMQPQNV